LQRFVGTAWDGPEPDPAGAEPDTRNALLANAKAGARGKSRTDSRQMIYPA